MLVAYVAGPYRNKSLYFIKQNIRRAEDVAVRLWNYGYAVICPHANTNFFDGAYGMEDDVWLKGDLEIISRCDILVVIPGWASSKGTKEEIKFARSLGIPVFFWEKEEQKIVDYKMEVTHELSKM